jgi:hypothetical protein
MDERSVQRTPAWTTIAAEQIRLVGLRFRVAGASLLAVGVLISGAFLWLFYTVGGGFIHSRNIALANHTLSAHVRANLAAPIEPMPAIYSPEISVVIVGLALLFPLALWQDEPPSQRGYHLVMPVRASTHTLTRVLAGWLWTMLVTALFLAAFVIVPVVEGWLPGALPMHVSYVAWWEWLVPFTTVTVAYLFASAAAVGARRPLVWLGGAIILYAGAVTLLFMLHMQNAAATLFRGFAGFYGAAAAMAGQVDWPVGVPSLARWLAATALWGFIAAVLLFTVARRRAEG